MNSFPWWALLIALVGDFAVPYILSLFYKGYSHITMVLSVLGNKNSPVRIFYNGWLVLLGALLVLSACAVVKNYWAVSKLLSIAVGILMTVFALGAGILAGFFSVGETKEMETIASKIHGFGASLGFMGMLMTPLLLAALNMKMNEPISVSIDVVAFICALVFFTLFIMADKETFQKTWVAQEGTWQRLSLLFMYIPLLECSVKYLSSPL